MADKTFGGPTGVSRKFKDMGDGTHAEIVYVGGSTGGGDASAANQTTGNASLASIDTKTPAKGTAAMAGSSPVTFATDDTQIGAKPTGSPALAAGGSGLIGWLATVADKLIAIIAQLPATLGIKTAAASLSVAPASDGVFTTGGTTTNPTSVLTRPADTTAYAANDLVASSTTAGSVVVPSVTVMRVAAGSGQIPKLILLSNHTTGLSGIAVAVRLWSAAPTYTNGDNGAYAVATGAAGFLGKFTGTFEQFADGAAAELAPAVGSFAAVKLASGQLIYWDLQVTAAATPQSAKTFTLVPQVLQD